jgi:hypothetical protein
MAQELARKWFLEYKAKLIATLFLYGPVDQKEILFSMRPEVDAQELASILLLLKDQFRGPDTSLVLRNEVDDVIIHLGEARLSLALLMTYYPHVDPSRPIGTLERIKRFF